MKTENNIKSDSKILITNKCIWTWSGLVPVGDSDLTKATTFGKKNPKQIQNELLPQDRHNILYFCETGTLLDK